jgi:hypothetical protein
MQNVLIFGKYLGMLLITHRLNICGQICGHSHGDLKHGLAHVTHISVLNKNKTGRSCQAHLKEVVSEGAARWAIRDFDVRGFETAQQS